MARRNLDFLRLHSALGVTLAGFATGNLVLRVDLWILNWTYARQLCIDSRGKYHILF